jgi:hypothetical protein
MARERGAAGGQWAICGVIGDLGRSPTRRWRARILFHCRSERPFEAVPALGVAAPYAALPAKPRCGLKCCASFFLELNTLHWTVPMGMA